MNSSKILYEKGNYWVLKAKHGFEVYKVGITHSTRCAIIGYEGKEGMDKAIKEKVLMKRHCPITKRGRWMEVWVKESVILTPMPY